MKRIFSIILAAAFCLCLAACAQAARDDDLTDGGDTGGVTDGGGSGNTDGGGDADSAIQLTTVYGGKSVDLCDPLLREYLEEEDFQAQCDFLLEHEGEDFAYQNISFAWDGDGSQIYSVWFADNAAFEDALVVETAECTLSGGLFLPGETYYWKVIGDAPESESAADSFAVLDMPVRFLDITGAYNVRDAGGWATESGQRVRWGMLYRGSQLNGYKSRPMPEEGIVQMRDVLGIRSEIDLRIPDVDDAGQTQNYLDAEAPYLKATIHPYTTLVEDFDSDDEKYSYYEPSAEAIRNIFALLSDESNYPVYYHCNSGADRAGSLTYLLNGLLGVGYDDLTRDFEITSFSGMGNRWRGSAESGFTDGIMSDGTSGFTYVAWGKMHELFMKYYATDSGLLSDAVENYLLNVCEVPAEHIQKFREIMLVG